MQYSNDIKKDYIETRESIKLAFPEAYNFLTQTENLLDKGFYVGTYKNLHLYYKTSFLFYFSKISSRVVGLSSKFNRNIKNGTVNNSDYFFDFLLPKLSDFKDDTNNTLEIKNVEIITFVKWLTTKFTVTKSLKVHELIFLINLPNNKRILLCLAGHYV